MMPALDRLVADNALLKALQIASIGLSGIVGGVAVSMYVWIIPIILQANDTRTKITQFNLNIAKGHKYLQPASQVLVFAFISLAVVFSRSSDPTLATQWKYSALAASVMTPTAPYGIYFMFPINDRVAEMGKELEKVKGKLNFDDRRDKGVDELLKRWRRMHVGRIVTTVGAFLVSIWSAIAG